MSFTHNRPEYSVSEISAQVKRVVEDTFGYVRVRGEISKVTVNQASGHAYLTLKDERSVLDAVCWKGTMSKLTHRPQAGLEVIATGKLTTYPGRSNYQLVIEALEPAGVGALMALLDQRKKALAAEGLFDLQRKKPLPFLPEIIGIVASPTGAVIRDILHRLADRFPRRVLLWPVAVQGQGAAEQVSRAIAGFNAMPIGQGRPDLLIVARGGGSIEDLWAFNEEIVVRAAAASDIPLISAVGHETDTTLIDYAADRRAPTPTAAAEIAVPVRDELRMGLNAAGLRMDAAIAQQLQYRLERLDGLARGLPKPQQLVATMAQSLDMSAERLENAVLRMIAVGEERLLARAAQLSPRFIGLHIEGQQQQVEAFGVRAKQAMQRLIDHRTSILHRLGAAQLAPQVIALRVEREHHALMALADRADQSIARLAERKTDTLARLGDMLESLNILAVLQRGFALVQDGAGRVVPSSTAITPGQAVTLRFHDGTRGARVDEF